MRFMRASSSVWDGSAYIYADSLIDTELTPVKDSS